MKAGYTGISVTPEARDAVRRFQAVAGGKLATRITVSDALLIAVHLAEQHADEVPAAALAVLTTSEGESK